ncbi:putative AlkP superfamily pyrophosphatase or phosphodiesterase [Algoriphagus iocasae]|uniref:Putative AlkP superfamily pyrophosphatase or phosphodiesterase n=1 Tax=Algoriphagus iocasae TaxID=1836499 RepID=A0A841MI52_9BACT|nr:ectonucleotide pyrophosphatase/phosphodiesterase [Algoriphagus iocasae]MBB6324999.1 putative AlkP superfamily pyrophosphatase or phosphodiesterase [Algoriphagus iocasae]
MKKLLILILLLVFGLQFFAFSQDKKEPVVILISLDGFRYDYVERFQPENLSRFISSGTAAKSLIPSFPTKTFPNHYTIATGMRPEHHGIVDNSFFNPERNQVYQINKRELITDGSWYGGTPLWVLAEKNGMKAASYFFVGSEADVQKTRPSYYFDYDARINNLTRVSQVFEWLQMPDSIKPRMITMYFSDMDDVGHMYGAENDEKLSETLYRLDRELGALIEGVKSLDQDVNIIIVSDHGMANVSAEKYIPLDKITDGVSGKVVNSGALAHIYLDDPADKLEAIKKLKEREVGFVVFDPADKNYYQDISVYGDRIGDIIILADLGNYFMDNEEYREVISRRMRMDETSVRGTHGFSQKYPEMHGIFYSNGPQIKEGMKIDSFDNIHIYPLICEILGLPVPEDIDGDLKVLEPILK